MVGSEVLQILPRIDVFTYKPFKAGLVGSQMKRQPTRLKELMRKLLFILCKNKRSAEHNCNLTSVKTENMVGGCADALFLAHTSPRGQLANIFG